MIEAQEDECIRKTAHNLSRFNMDISTENDNETTPVYPLPSGKHCRWCCRI